MKKALYVLFLLALLLGLTSIAATQEFDACLAEPEIITTADGVEFVRTPDACFENLPDWPYESQYVEIDGLRQGYIDAGSGESGETILLLHGQPSWSYLYRKMIPVLAEEGHRVIAMDHIGFGHSDKPVDPDYYTYVGHVERLEAFIQELEIEQGNLTIFVQDWGSLIGLQVVGTNPNWFDRVVVGNGFLPVFEEGITPAPLPENTQISRNFYYSMITTIPAMQPDFYDEDGNQVLTLMDAADFPPALNELLEQQDLDASASQGDDEPMASIGGGAGFGVWIDYARNDERFVTSQVVEAMTYFDLSDEELAAYDAPYPSRIAMGGPRAFPGLINQLPGVTQAGWAGLGEFEKPFLTIWGDNDPGNLGQPAVQQTLIDHIPGSEGWDHVRLEEASHFLQNDQGAEIARRINEFITQTSG